MRLNYEAINREFMKRGNIELITAVITEEIAIRLTL